MEHGAYEKVIDLQTERQLRQIDALRVRIETRSIDPAEAVALLVRHVGDAVLSALSSVRGSDRTEKLIELCNQAILSLSHGSDTSNIDGFRLPAEPRELLSLSDAGPGSVAPSRPEAPLAWGALFTGARTDPNLVSQLLKELETADALDLLVSFIKFSGLTLIQTALRRFAERGKKIRVITTSYMGATDVKAVAWLAELDTCEVRVSYDTHRTRLHAKSYILHRGSGFGSAYVGSANLSQAAMTDGLEWTVKISQREQSYLFDRVASTFQAYWEDADFESFVSGDVDRLATAIAEQRSSATSRAFLFDLRPYTFQQEILDRLAIEREQQGRRRQLIVAATGTGKTMIAAFDYRRLVEARRHAPRMLFVAHRIELLQQALESFRAVLKDPNFGELLGGGSIPRSRDHLFATIQSINSQDLLEFVSPDHYEYVVVDEFHHAPAAQYQRLLEWLQPTILVGMTATPERMSVGAASWDVFGFFDQHVSAEIRLPDAIQRKLLSPFHYFGVTDTVDYSQVSWSRGSYDQNQLDNLLTGDMMRAQRVFSALEERVADPNSMRCLGFCVSVRHAEFMAQCFRSLDIKAHAITSASSVQDREILPNALRRGDIQVLFTVDLFNEGIDIPELDTVLLLRPTESLTVFLQQLGRGLRLSDKKDCLTVLDFVGHMHRHFRFDDRLRALTTKPEADMRAQVQSGFPWLPAGCHLELEEQAMRHVLENISEHLGRRGKREWVAYLREYAGSIGRKPSLHDFLRHLRRTPSDLYRVSSWTELLALAGLGPTAVTEPTELDALQRFAAIDDDLRLDALESVLAGHEPNDQRLTLMLCALALPSSTPRFDYPSLVETFNASSVLSTDLRELTAYLKSESELWTIAANLRHGLPLRLHASYTRGEVLAALGSWTPERRFTEQSGNRWVEDIRTDALFVTLNKSSREFSPTTMYEDYAISDRLFHWQSQSGTAIESNKAKRYIEHAALGNTILLFVRENRKRGRLAEPFVFLGPVEHVSHHGTRPVNFTWRIETPIPARFVHELQHLTA